MPERMEFVCSTQAETVFSLLSGAFQTGSPPEFETGMTTEHLQHFKVNSTKNFRQQ